MRDNFIKKILIENLNNDTYFSKIEGLNKSQLLSFDRPITFFTGENGTGKSTLVEAIAVKMGFNAEGGSKNFNFSTQETHSELHNHLKIIRSARRATDGFFYRAESFYNAISYAEEIFDNPTDVKYGHQQSHGESFLNLVTRRFKGNGLYILDEPESALSLQRQLSLLVAINDLIKDGSQFIIATHSPILLAMPDSQIISLDPDTPLEITYEESKPFEIINLFLNNRESMLSKMLNND